MPLVGLEPDTILYVNRKFYGTYWSRHHTISRYGTLLPNCPSSSVFLG